MPETYPTATLTPGADTLQSRMNVAITIPDTKSRRTEMADVLKAAELICYTEQVYVELARSEAKKSYAVHEQVGVALKAISSCHKDFDKAVKAMHSKLVLKVPSVSIAKRSGSEICYLSRLRVICGHILPPPRASYISSRNRGQAPSRTCYVLSSAQGPHHRTPGGPVQVI